MERFTWEVRLLPGMKQEYIHRHDEIWLEMTQLLNDPDIHNYTIWCVGDELLGYYEADMGVAFAAFCPGWKPCGSTARTSTPLQKSGLLINFWGLGIQSKSPCHQNHPTQKRLPWIRSTWACGA